MDRTHNTRHKQNCTPCTCMEKLLVDLKHDFSITVAVASWTKVKIANLLELFFLYDVSTGWYLVN